MELNLVHITFNLSELHLIESCFLHIWTYFGEKNCTKYIQKSNKLKVQIKFLSVRKFIYEKKMFKIK